MTKPRLSPRAQPVPAEPALPALSPAALTQLVADLAASDAEADRGDLVPWETLEAELIQSEADCRARIARRTA